MGKMIMITQTNLNVLQRIFEPHSVHLNIVLKKDDENHHKMRKKLIKNLMKKQ